ncbi:MAG: glutamyl-tRNA reductase [Proteobacteria bacterium]|nr:glutamyl-tRNA reductase [Pseudomonadota bacterium]
MAAPDNDPASRLFVVGVNQRSASAMLCERLFAEEIEPSALLARLRAAGDAGAVAEAMVLSTCERLEVMAVADAPAAGAQALVGLLAEETGTEADEFGAGSFRHLGAEALRHIFAVTASLDSQTVGEPQILGQVKESHRRAVEAGTAGPALDAVLQAAYGAAKRVRSETSLAEHPVSIAASALLVARDVHGALERRGVLLAGLGEMGEFMAAELIDAGVGDLVVMHASLGRAEAVAHRLGCHFRPWSELDDALAGADIVVAATGTGRYTITGPLAEAALKRRRREPIFFIDTAIPGDVDPAVARLDGAFVYDLEDLERVALEGKANREAETEAAWRILDEELAEFLRRRAERVAVPSVAALRRHFESARAAVLAEGGTGAEEATRRLINRLLHDPSEVLRAAAAGDRDPQGRAALEAALRRVFRIDAEKEDDK